MTTFEGFGIGKSILKALDEIGFTTPTPIQEKAIPVIKSGKDVLGIAQTGTGKTAAYVIPLLMKLVKAEGKDPRAIVLVPTRELAIQVERILQNSPSLPTSAMPRFTEALAGPNMRHCLNLELIFL